ncbi:FtsB family cell division protein [Deinococcus sp. Marseille-Q6407]|uniref:FtsB family cell division protein n=1 Tax=Deinococcus sp. Marseille-Q6407 TaxID=2969223 RepID=UPI0021C213BE|nr:septum formation initiator family protein [Deinococcus sp. Marseille-Q6407]
MSSAVPPSSSSVRRRRRPNRLWVRLGRIPLMPMALCLLCGLGSVQMLFHMGNGIYRSVTWEQETRQTQAENAHLRQEIQILNDAKAQLNNPEYLEQQARCWGYVGRDEKVLVVQNAPAKVGSNCDEYRLP